MSKSALKRVRKAIGLEVCREPLPAYAWPGGYPIVYVFADGGICCPDCANKEIELIDAETRPGVRDTGWKLAGFQVFHEGAPERCAHCNKEVESAYGDPEAKTTLKGATA